MKKFKVFALAAAAMIVGLTSCNKNNDGVEQPTGENFNVTLTFTDPATRADQAAVTGTPTVDVDNGYICFVASDKSITQVYKLVSAAPGAGEVANGTGVKNFTDVPGASTSVYLIANIGSTTAPTTSDKIDTYLNTNVMNIENQTDVAKVVIVGSDDLAGTATAKSATINPTTKVTRVQIKEIEFGAGFTAGTIEGIYINGFYKSLKLDGTAGTLSTSTTDTDFVGSSAFFGATFAGVLYDEFSKPVTAAVTPTNGVWGYNLFATGATPQIIIKLKDVNVGSGVLAEMYATIGTFKKGASDINVFEAGKYYTIDKITIPANAITPEPGVKTFTADVTVNTVTWAEENITGTI